MMHIWCYVMLHSTITITAIEPRTSATWWKLQWSNRASVLMTGRSPAYKASISPSQYADGHSFSLSSVVLYSLVDWRRSCVAIFGSSEWNANEWDKNARTRVFVLFSTCAIFAQHSTRVLNHRRHHRQRDPKTENNQSLSFQWRIFYFIFIAFARFGKSWAATLFTALLMLRLLRFALLLLCSIMNKSWQRSPR